MTDLEWIQELRQEFQEVKTLFQSHKTCFLAIEDLQRRNASMLNAIGSLGCNSYDPIYGCCKAHRLMAQFQEVQP